MHCDLGVDDIRGAVRAKYSGYEGFAVGMNERGYRERAPAQKPNNPVPPDVRGQNLGGADQLHPGILPGPARD